MNILYNSIYKHDLKKPEKFKLLDQDIECEIAIIGGGFTGLSCAQDKPVNPPPIIAVSYTHLTLPTILLV